MAEELDAPFDWWRTNKNTVSPVPFPAVLCEVTSRITNHVSRKPVYWLTGQLSVCCDTLPRKTDRVLPSSLPFLPCNL